MINAIISSFKTSRNESMRRGLQIDVSEKLCTYSEAVQEFQQLLIEAYNDDHLDDIEYYSRRLKTEQAMVRYYKGVGATLSNLSLKSIFSVVRFQQKKERELLAQEPIDFRIEQAKRAHEQRLEEAEAWLDSLPVQEQLDRLNNLTYYAGCPIGNFAAIEASNIVDDDCDAEYDLT